MSSIRGAPDLFPIVIGFTAFVIAIVALFAAIALAWRFTHRGRRTEVDRQAMVNFAGMGLFGLFAGASFIGAVICVAALVQGLGDQATYQHAPNCQTTSTSLCRRQTDGRVGRTWAESSRGRHWIEVSALGRNQTIEVTTATDVWLTLVRGSRVTVTSWKGHVAEVTVPGVGSMQTVDSPNYGLIAAIGLSVLSLAGLVIFSVWALIFWVKWRTASRGIDTSQTAA